MKVQHFKIKKYTLLKLHLIKYQAYKFNLKNFNPLKKINYLESSLKQALNLIYFYHFNDKRILFVGFPYNKNIRKLNLLQHFFLPRKCWVNGLFYNKNAKIQYMMKQSSLATTTPFGKNDPDLVVLFNISKKEQNILTEISSIGCPLIIIGNQIPFNVPNTIYSVPGFFFKKNIKQLCFFLIQSILKLKKFKFL